MPRLLSRKHDQAEFRQGVLLRYGAINQELGVAWCYITHMWCPRELVKAAHLVPKILTGDETAFLFGVKEIVLKDARNGMSLHKKIEIALDSGRIVIIPSSLPKTHQAYEWKCILVDQNDRDETACSTPGASPTAIRWKQLDGRKLAFLTANRPTRQYLYFRFIVTYLHAKMVGNTAFTSSVESRKEFWASPGEYLHSSTLKSLARNISGLELPPSLMSITFNYASVSSSEAETVGTTLAADLQRATIESSKRWERRQEGEEGEEDEEDELAHTPAYLLF